MPVIPRVEYKETQPARTARPQTWVDVICEDAHHSTTGGHASAKDMLQRLQASLLLAVEAPMRMAMLQAIVRVADHSLCPPSCLL